jgi:hypothetical protein
MKSGQIQIRKTKLGHVQIIVLFLNVTGQAHQN